MQSEPLFPSPSNANKMQAIGVQNGWSCWMTWAETDGVQSVVVRLHRKGKCPVYGMWIDGAFDHARARCLRTFKFGELLKHLEDGCACDSEG